MKTICISLLLLTGLSVSGAAAAQACPGKLVALEPIRQGWPDGPKLGEVQLYWDAASGNNCVRTMHSDRTWGQPMRTQAVLTTCARSNFTPGQGCNGGATRIDDDVYRYQAGPISLPGRDRCVSVQGQMANYATGFSGHCR